MAVAKCTSYGAEYVATLEKMFDQLGGLGRLVKGKTVGIKINMTGDPSQRLGYLDAGLTHFTHPPTITAVIHLLDKAGARRIRVLEGPMAWPDSLEEAMYKAGWEVSHMSSAAPRVEFYNTNLPFPGKKPYTRFTVPNGGHLFPAYDLNTAYAECDVLVSMNKVKEHATAGVTLSMKNCFGITPCTIYGDRAGVDEPSPSRIPAVTGCTAEPGSRPRVPCPRKTLEPPQWRISHSACRGRPGRCAARTSRHPGWDFEHGGRRGSLERRNASLPPRCPDRRNELRYHGRGGDGCHGIRPHG